MPARPRRMHACRPLAAGVAFVAGAAFSASCRTPTEITLVLSTDEPCARLRGTSITVGRAGDLEARPATASSTSCDASGELGALVVVPSGDTGDEVAFKLVGGVGRDAKDCAPPYGAGCIVARRTIRFVPHAPLRILVPLRAACDGVPCSADDTCVAGACIPASILDPAACEGDGCGEEALGQTPSRDGGVDAGAAADGAPDGSAHDADAALAEGGAPVYAEMSDPSKWQTTDLSSLGAVLGTGGTFDGRFVYFPGNRAARYDTTASFTALSSWSTFDTTALNDKAHGFAGAAFDGSNVYFVPGSNGSPYGIVPRYDTKAAFTANASWQTFDTSVVDTKAQGYQGAAFDGRYLYFAPSKNTAGVVYDGVVARYDTQAAFGVSGSWSTFDAGTLAPGAVGFAGAVFDGRYVYFVPSAGALIARFDVLGTFSSAASWSTFDPGVVSSSARGFFTGAFDGRYVYLVPYSLALVTRYDTLAPFGAAASWSTFDVTTVDSNAVAPGAAAFDGRYLYLVPTSTGVLVRYDTSAAFTAIASWSSVGTIALTNAAGFDSAVFDGQYLYLGFGNAVARFAARTSGALPKLPGFYGSFY